MPLSTQSAKIPIRDITIFAALGAIMFASKIIMQGLPNMHLLGLFIASITLAYRQRALIPLYVYVFLDGLFSGFAFWWIPYLYIWLPLWGAFMLVGKLTLSKRFRIPLYMVICAVHGLLFGIMYAPAQAFFFGLSFNMTITWIIAGLWFDVIHAITNFAAATMILPLSTLLTKLSRPQN
jgi:energy-coupling factor transport system substrate-specific component